MRRVAWLLLAAASAAAPARAQGVLEREIHLPRERLTISERDGATELRYEGALPESRPGMPDLPVLAEPIELPPGQRVRTVEVISLEGETLPSRAWIPPARVVRAGEILGERTPPDPRAYARPGLAPDPAVALGGQGSQRGVGRAYLLVRPVRWDPLERRLERIERLRVRLTLELDPGVVRRERIVPEWEDGAAARIEGTPRGGTPVGSAVGARPKAQPFMPTQLPSVLGSPVAYVIVTSDALASEFQRLADWKTQSGVPAAVRTLSFIRQEYPFGADDADRIRRFIRDAYARWGTKWVLLGGDTDVIPTRIVYNSFESGGVSLSDIACDLYYSCLDGDWNANGNSIYGEGDPTTPNDQVDLLPEVWVGRAPVTTVAQAAQFVDKTFQYTRTPVGDYENHTLFFSEVLFPQNWSPGMQTTLDGAEVSESCTPYLRANPAQRYGRLYENHLDPRWEPGAIQEFKARVVDSLDVGYNISVHVGHGFRNVMSCGDLNLTNADAAGLTNGNRLTNLYAANCTSNAIDYPCLGEAFLQAAGGGAVTSIGSTRVDFPSVGRYFQTEYFRLVFEDSVSAIGEAQGRQKLPFVAFSDYETAYRWTEMTLILLGDPELHLWTGRPRTLVVTHPASLVLGGPTLTVNVKIGAQPLYGARVTVYKAGDEYRTATTDGAGNAVLEVRPDGLGSLTVTVTAYDCRPYQAVIPVTAASQEVLVDQPYTLDDDAIGGSHGNGNQIPEAGETVDLQIPIRNAGGTTANGVTATLSTIDPMVTILTAANTYGTLAAGAVSSGSSWFRFATPYTLADQREVPFALTLKDLNGHTFAETLRITLRAPELRSMSHAVAEVAGNGNGRPEPGETVDYSPAVRNLGTGTANAVAAILRCTNGLATVTDSSAVYGVIAPGTEVTGDPFRFTVGDAAARFELRLSTADGLLAVQPLDLSYPAVPTGLGAQGSHSTIALTWSPAPEGDLMGYNVYRSGPGGGTLAKISTVPTTRTSYVQDLGLAALTQYDYAITAVDSSGNESARTGTIRASTNPPNHAVFPIAMARNTPGSVAVAHLYAQPGGMDIVAGADVLYCWHADGTSPVDADASSVTSGDFTTLGSYYAAGPSVADLDGGGLEIIGPTWDSQSVYVFDLQGQLKPGWPFAAGYPIWSSAAAGDLGNDGHREIVFGSNGPYVFALKPDGTQWIDGDANPATNGVFKNIGSSDNFGTPALADVDGNGQLDIVYGASNGVLYAWRPNGTNLPGFPVTIGGTITASAAIGYLDGAGDTQLEIVIAANDIGQVGKDSLYVFKRDGGRRAGFPVYLPGGGTSKQPSPALADIDRNGTLDIVMAGTDGRLYVYDRNGVLNPSFANVHYSALTSQSCESSPVVADINGDGAPDIVIGDENGLLSAFGANGALLPGFPIQLGAEVRGTPALCDCDGDGKTEIVEAGWDSRLYVWDYDFPFSPSGAPAWPQFHHDAMRTGLASAATLIGVPEAESATLRLASAWPNPARRSARLDYGVAAGEAGAALEIAVFDLGGRKLRVLASGPAAPGRGSTTWDLRDAAGVQVPAGVYFARLTLAGRSETRRFVVAR